MIQRKQTIFLLIALVLNIVCLCLPVGRFVSQTMGVDATLTNLWIRMSDGSLQFSAWYLFAILLLSCPVTIWAIISYKNRLFQARLCLCCMLLMVFWYIGYSIVKFWTAPDLNAELVMAWTYFLPFVSLVFYFLARRGIMADEKLVRSMDRIR